MSDLKAALQRNEHKMGIMVTAFPSVDMPKVLKACGFDFFMVDCEHGAFTTREVANMMAVARALDFPGLVRIPEMRREHALKFIELGASGLLLPGTESAEQAKMLVDCVKYAPLGHRGVSLSRPHTDFEKITDAAAYMAKANRETILLCQIESRLGVENIDEILAVEGIDAALMGPNDLTQDYGILDQFDNPITVQAFEKVIAAAKKNGKLCGAHFGAAAPLMPWLAKGMTFNMWNSDVGLMKAGAAELANLRAAAK